MSKFIIEGGHKLNGDFQVLGAKNAALKMIAASVMLPGKTTIDNVPKIEDVFRMIQIVESLGVKSSFSGNKLTLEHDGIKNYSPNAESTKKLRGSVVIAGPLISILGKAEFYQPGGCLIGARPIDSHLSAFEKLGIKSTCIGEKFILEATKDYYTGDKKVILDEMSVTGTENVLMASVLRPGKTTIMICAAEPEIKDLADFLNAAGANISGAGTNTITVVGVNQLHSTDYKVMPDRIEAGTIAIAAALTGGKITVKDIIPDHMSLVLNKFRLVNLDFEIIEKQNGYCDMIVDQKSKLKAIDAKWLDTRPYPGFPTDLQSPFAVLLTQADGATRIFETLFESRFDYVLSLQQMGAKIEIENPHIIEIFGPTKLKAREIFCSDLRGGAALVIAGLIADGETILNNIEYVDRGYENFDQRLNALGAKIKRVK